MKALILSMLILLNVVISQKTRDNLKMRQQVQERRKTILKCISESTKVSNTLKEYCTKEMSSEKIKPLDFSKLTLGEDDREIIKTCKRKKTGKFLEIFKNRLLKCIISNANSSDKLKQYAKSQKGILGKGELDFKSINPSESDQKIIQECLNSPKPKIKVDLVEKKNKKNLKNLNK